MQAMALHPTAAVVSRAPMRRHEPVQYLTTGPSGVAAWTSDLEAATAFDTMREATRAAMRLPSELRAFSLPLHAELATRETVH